MALISDTKTLKDYLVKLREGKGDRRNVERNRPADERISRRGMSAPLTLMLASPAPAFFLRRLCNILRFSSISINKK